MAKINFTHKSQEDQLRILNDYLIRRAQHKTQFNVTIDQIVNRFKHNRCFTKKAKAIYFSRLMHILENNRAETTSGK
jgi:ribosome-interacting GTPase 1